MFFKTGGQPYFCPQFPYFSFYLHIRYECILAFFCIKILRPTKNGVRAEYIFLTLWKTFGSYISQPKI